MAEISKITIPVGNGTQTYDIKDATARAAIAGGTAFAGITTTALTDGASTASISVGGESVTAVNGMMAIYNSKEFVYASSDSKCMNLAIYHRLEVSQAKTVQAVHTHQQERFHSRQPPQQLLQQRSTVLLQSERCRLSQFQTKHSQSQQEHSRQKAVT